jgi:transcriptional regulator with XRE-family HTH domain
VTGAERRELGRRIAAARRTRGLTQEAAAQLVGRSTDWLKKIERGSRGTGLVMLVRLAEVLGVDDLSHFLGGLAPGAVHVRPVHQALDSVRRAMADRRRLETEPSLEHLDERVRRAWMLRSRSQRDRTDLAAVLPGLLVDVQAASRGLDVAGRRQAARLLARTYHLAQLYLCYQQAPELLWVAADRGLNAAQDADDPNAIALATWFSAHLYRDSGAIDQAHQVVADTVPVLRGEPGPQLLRSRSLVHLASALNWARDGQPGEAWRAWDLAEDADSSGAAPHPADVLYGQTIEDVALSLDVELGKASAAVRRAEATDAEAIISLPRRSRLLIEVGRGHMLRKEHTAAVHMLRGAVDTSPEATRFSLFARPMVEELQASAGRMLQPEIRRLAADLRLTAA